MTDYRLRISGRHYNELRAHLFPGDGLEAAAFILCGRRNTATGVIFLSHEVILVPYDICDRHPNRVTWKSDVLPPILDKAKQRGFSVLKVHSHTASYEKFSPTDDESDTEVFRAVEDWTNDSTPNASLVMLPTGRMFGRSSEWKQLSQVAVVGSELAFWRDQNGGNETQNPSFEANEQLFGIGTTTRLRDLRMGVVGCSGTGSVVIELLARLGVGTLLLIDHDRVERRNLNRIVNATLADVGKFKADVIKAAIESHGLDTKIEAITQNLFEPDVVRKVAECDVVFGCMDTAEGRHLLNRLATFYVIPYFDLGVHLSADGTGGIDEASGAVHYVEPGRSSLYSRGAYGMDRVKAEGLKRTNPGEYEERRKVNYIEGVDEQAPAVISVNATIAGLAVNEFLARLHPFRSCSSEDCTVVRYNFMETLVVKEPESEPCEILERHLGRGDVDPLLDMPALSKQ